MEQVLDIRPVKAKLRKDFKRRRQAMPKQRKAILDRKIQNKLMNLWAYREASAILTYVSTPIEVNTHYLIEAALKSGKTVAVPRCEGEGRRMNFYVIESFDELAPGSFGVLEPFTQDREPVKDFDNSLCIVPGFSFDKQGFRLGYGKGYYDRFLREYTGIAVGICYYDYLKERLPHGKYDRAMHMLVTEKGTYSIAKKG